LSGNICGNSDNPAVDIFKIFWANPSYQQQTLRWFFPKRQPYTIPAVLH